MAHERITTETIFQDGLNELRRYAEGQQGNLTPLEAKMILDRLDQLVWANTIARRWLKERGYTTGEALAALAENHAPRRADAARRHRDQLPLARRRDAGRRGGRSAGVAR